MSSNVSDLFGPASDRNAFHFAKIFVFHVISLQYRLLLTRHLVHLSCLSVFDQNSETNYAVRKTSNVIKALMRRMNVTAFPVEAAPKRTFPQERTPAAAALSPTAFHPSYQPQSDPAHSPASVGSVVEPTMIAGQFAPDLDVDAIMQNFMNEQQMNEAANVQCPSYGPNPGFIDNGSSYAELNMADGNFFEDALFGFNSSAFDWFDPMMLQGFDTGNPNQMPHS
jgi:hypothetical protein